MSEQTPLVADLVWSGRLYFDATSGAAAVSIDGDGVGGPSPMQAMAIGIAGCMSADVVSILQKGRHGLTGYRARLLGTRAEAPPRRFTHLRLEIQVHGPVPQAALDRAVALSREKYCSAFASLRPDVALDVFTSIQP